MKKIIKALAAVMLMIVAAFTIGCNNTSSNSSGDKEEKTVKVDEGIGNGTFNGHEYVDLGLPSGTLWATCNVGATTPEGYGDYFAWGETSTTSIYDWSTYKYANGDFSKLTKYCNDSRCGYNGFTDNQIVLQPSDDAATANWGSGWCMPTKEQWQELYENTNNTWTTRNGVNGRLVNGRFFTASNGDSLFLPAAGVRWGGGLGFVDYGSYWSSSLDTVYPNFAWTFRFGSLDCGMDGDFRGSGRSVRAVRSAHQN